MDTDVKVPLNKFIEDTVASAEVGAFDFSHFVAGLESYGISMPGYLSPIYTELASVPPDKAEALLKQFINGVFEQEVPTGAEGLKQFDGSSDIQSSLPDGEIDQNRVKTIREAQKALSDMHGKTRDRLKTNKEDIEWRRSLAQNFTATLRKKRLAGQLTDIEVKSVEKTVERLAENPIIAKTREEARKKLAERISQEETFARFRQAARESAEETLAQESMSRSWDYATITTAETIISNPTIHNVEPVVSQINSATRTDGSWDHERIEEIARVTRIESVATNPPRDTTRIPLTDAFIVHKPESVSRDDTINHAFSVTLTNTLTDKSVEKMKEHLGKAAKEPSFHQFVQNSREEATKRSGGDVKNKVSGFIVTTSAPDADMQTYLETIYKTSAESATPNPEAFFAAKAHANHPDHFHFEYLPSPFEWIASFGKKSAAKTATKTTIGAAAGAVTKQTAKELGASLLLKLGLSAKVASFFGGPVGWVAGIGLTFFPGLASKVGAGIGSATGKFTSGAVGSVSIASKGISSIVQAWLGGNIRYKDPLATNTLLLAATPVFIAIIWLPFAIAYFRNQFIPIGDGAPSGTADIPGTVIDCSLPENKTDPLCTFTACVPSAADPNSCKWPTTGYVTQGPHTETTCGGNVPSSSHDSGTAANGIDFGGGPGSSGVTQVITVRSGTVDVVVNECGLNSGKIGNTCGGGYGNHVIINSDDGYRMIYAHLAPGIPVSVGQKVNAGDPVGKMDQTGNSTGSHLHFGVLSGGNVLDLIPPNDSAALPDQINHCLDSCGKACPGGLVSP